MTEDEINQIAFNKHNDILNNIIKLTNNYYKKSTNLLKKFDKYYLDHLPSLELKDDKFYDDRLLPRISCIYFLKHETKGLLYIGKAKDLRSRWVVGKDKYGQYYECHHMLERSLRLGNIKLVWYKICPSVSLFVETILIGKFRPQWNTIK